MKLTLALATLTFGVIAIALNASADPALPTPKCRNPLTDVGSPCGTSHSWLVTIYEIGATEQGRWILPFFARNGPVEVNDLEENKSDTLTFTDEIITDAHGKKRQATVVDLVSDPFAPPSPAESEKYSARNPIDQTNATYKLSSPVEPTPEPSTLFLTGTVLAGVAVWRRATRRRKMTALYAKSGPA